MQTLKPIHTTRRRILSLLLTLTLIIGLFALAPLTAFAAVTNVYVDGTNVADVNGNSAVNGNSGAGWAWDGTANPKTLTLANYNSTGINLYGADDVKLVVSGTCTVTGRIDYSDGNLIISGTGSDVLNVSAAGSPRVLTANNIDISGLTVNVNATDSGIAVATNPNSSGNFTMTSGTLKLSSTDNTANGLVISGDITISGGTIQTDNTIAGPAVQAYGNINISGTAIVNVKSTGSAGIQASKSLTISGGVVTAEGRNAIRATNDIIDISGNSTVNATGTGTGYALSANGGKSDVSISGGAVVTTNAATGAGVFAKNVTVDGTGTTLTAQTGTAIDAKGDVTVSGGATVTGASGETAVVLIGSNPQTVTVDGSGSKIVTSGTGTAIDATDAKGAVTVNVTDTGAIDAGASGTAVVGTATVTGDGTGSVTDASGTTNPIDLTVPGAPVNVSATAGDAWAIVTFTAPANDGGAPITLYTATSNPGGITATDTEPSITVTGLTNGTTYTFIVTATNSVGPSEPSEESNAVTPSADASVTVPDAPTNVTATAGNAEATVTFDAPANDGGALITGYKVTAVEDPTKTATGTASPITVSGLTNGTTYTFTVTAANSKGPSEPSEKSNAVTPSADNPVNEPDGSRSASGGCDAGAGLMALAILALLITNRSGKGR